MNRMRDLGKYGQAPWLDYIRRNLLVGGGLSRLIEEDHVTGVTSNPTIFEKAISGSDDYDAAIAELLRSNPHLSASQIFEHIALADIRSAADFLRQVFDRTGGADGFVSFELSPRLVEADELIGEGRRLWSAIDRPNVMLKVPATKPAARAIETLISEGININVTLLFSLSQYIRVAEAYLGGLEKTDNPESVASVASFFVSRVDAAADARLEETRPENSADLAGRLGVANCKVAYDRFKQIFRGKRWDDLASRGARPQRLLWASTSTKNPAFPDTKYVDELIGEQTVNTMPPSTIEAFCDHGRARPTLGVELEEAQAVSAAFKSLGIDPELLGEKLQEDGLAAFTASYDDFLSALEKKRRLLLAGRAGSMKLDLGPCEQEHADQLRRWKSDDYSARLWKKDKSLWGSEDDLEISNRLGWLWLPQTMHDEIPGLLSFADEVRSDGIQSVVLLGMGGSSLAPEVFQKVFGSADGYPALRVLDSTHPAAVRRVEDGIDLGRTLFIVASKSGTTLEPLSGFRYFWQKLEEQGVAPAPQFVAVTDPGTPLAELAETRGFRAVFEAPVDVGGRYSALTVFGLLPAALIGVDLHKLLDRAWAGLESCAFCVGPERNPGLMLGAALGILAEGGLDKLTFRSPEVVSPFLDWVEQLIAESTGKGGTGILPVVHEPPATRYGEDRVIVEFSVGTRAQGSGAPLGGSGPTIRIDLEDEYDIGLEMFRWEIAVAAAGSVMGINPFDQPDVELAKQLARDEMEADGGARSSVEEVRVDRPDELEKALAEFVGSAAPGDYVAVHAYLGTDDAVHDGIAEVRATLLDELGVATTAGFGPRFLHSTGQLHKGGRNNGLFLQIVDEATPDIPVPDAGYSFGEIIRAQAIGDFRALKERGRRVLRVNLGSDVKGGLALLAKMLTSAT